MWLASLITTAKWRSNVSFCYLPQLGFSLLSKRSDPRIGKQTFTVTNLALADPDPQLFELPEGFTVVDERQTSPPEN